MKWYEVIYETGAISLVAGDDEEDVKKGLKAHHARALRGEPGTPANSAARPEVGMTLTTWPAERISKVYIYDQHPGDYGETGLVDEADLRKELDALIEKHSMQGAVHVPSIAADIRGITSAVKDRENMHDSQFKMESTGELDLAFLEGSE